MCSVRNVDSLFFFFLHLFRQYFVHMDDTVPQKVLSVFICDDIYFSISSILNTSAMYYFALPGLLSINNDYAIELMCYLFVR